MSEGKVVDCPSASDGEDEQIPQSAPLRRNRGRRPQPSPYEEPAAELVPMQQDDEPTRFAPHIPTNEDEEIPRSIRRIPMPPHRYTPCRNNWMELIAPLVEQLNLEVRMNVRTRCVEIRDKPTTAARALQKAADYLRAFALGFEIMDAVALLRLDDLFLESFEIKDVKRLQGDHLGRAIGRISGKDGKTKHAIENATRTRVVLADSKVHILGAFENIKMARDTICNLILGSKPGKVYNQLRGISKRLKERL